nr:MAG TPA: tail protein [Caudoviricetes sp.]
MGQKVEIYMTQQGARVVIPATQGENLAREYDFTVIGLDGQPVDMTGTTVVMYVLKGKDVVQVPATIAEDSAKIVLPSGACDVPGEHQCFIQIIKPDVFDLRVDNIILRVIPCDVDGAGEASSEFTLLTQLISEAEQAIENANTAAEEARTTAEETATTVATSTATNIINNQKGQPNGLATLDGNGKLVEKTGLATLAGNGKLSLEEVPSANSMEHCNLGVSEEIPKSSDLNNYTAAGTYRSPTKGTSETLVHSPRNDGGFKLIVTHNQSGNWISQIAVAESKLWIRNRNDSGTWGEWESVFIESSDSSTQATQRNHLGMNKVLWEGTWSSGKITIPNANRYRILLLATKARSSGSSIGTLIVACNYNTWLRGIGGYSTATPTMTHYYFNAQSDSDTSNTFNFIECTAQRNDGTNTTELSVAAIYGVV